METNLKYTDDMEQMREDMNELRSLLSNQKIVNERLMRRAMSKEMSKERRSSIMVCVLAVLASPLYVALMPVIGLPLWFVVVTILFLCVACVASVWSVGRLLHENLITGNLLVVAERIVEYKRFSNNWLKFGIPFICLWLATFFYIVHGNMDPDMGNGVLVGGGIGAVIGAVCGIKTLVDSRRRLNGVLEQIEEIKNTK